MQYQRDELMIFSSMFTRWTFTGGDCAETISWPAVQAAASKRVEIMTAVDRENNNYGIS